MSKVLKIFLIFLVTVVSYVIGHGMMLDPVGRQSRWRFNDSAPVNWNDNELFCGGLTNTWKVNKGKCGICGDDYGKPAPRPHEYGGLYGDGVPVATYRSGQIVPISIMIVANHRGFFTFDLCDMDNRRESDECFEALQISDGSDFYELKSTANGMFYTSVRLPPEITCNHCVLRWTWKAANMWGICENGIGALGCGPQEIYRSCADITIRSVSRF